MLGAFTFISSGLMAGEATVTYLANAGVLIEAGVNRVVIDGLHQPCKPAFACLPEEERDKFEAAKAPYHEIDLLLVSHKRRDHFHPQSVGRNLQHSSEMRLIAAMMKKTLK